VYLDDHLVHNLNPEDPLFVGSQPEGVECTQYPNGKRTPEAMSYYQSSHGHNDSVINGIGRIGTMYGGSHALWDDETMADEFVQRTSRWLEARKKEQPFFLFFSSQDIHVPRAPHPRFRGKTKLGHRGDAMVALDWAVGEILRVLEQQGLAENTIVIFSSDNGPVYDDGYDDGTVVLTSQKEVDQGHDGSGPFRGGKYQIYEGGTRVPFLLRWPGHVKPGISDALVNQIDLIASFASLLEIELGAEDAIDSRDSLSAFLGEEELGLTFMLEEANGLALREGRWKLIRLNQRKGQGTRRAELYDLQADPGEEVDVADAHPELVERLDLRLNQLKNSAGLRQLELSERP
jgi:arylsulfatase A